jgi:hypothetical protein
MISRPSATPVAICGTNFIKRSGYVFGELEAPAVRHYAVTKQHFVLKSVRHLKLSCPVITLDINNPVSRRPMMLVARDRMRRDLGAELSA